jgi:hypothetical protein
MNSLSSTNLSLFQEADATFLRAPSLLSGMSHFDAQNIAVGIIENINGAGKVLMPSFDGIQFKALGFRDEQGEIKRHYFLFPQSGNFVLHTSGVNDPTLLELLNLTTINPTVAKALTLYGSLVHNWKNLYMVVEVIEEDLGGESMVMKSYPEVARRLKDFKRTSNNFGAIGREARHAKEFEAPSKSMQIEEAQEFVRQLLFQWLSTKVKNA